MAKRLLQKYIGCIRLVFKAHNPIRFQPLLLSFVLWIVHVSVNELDHVPVVAVATFLPFAMLDGTIPNVDACNNCCAVTLTVERVHPSFTVNFRQTVQLKNCWDMVPLLVPRGCATCRVRGVDSRRGETCRFCCGRETLRQTKP